MPRSARYKGCDARIGGFLLKEGETYMLRVEDLRGGGRSVYIERGFETMHRVYESKEGFERDWQI